MSMKSTGVDAGSTDDEVHMDPLSAGGRLNFALSKSHVVLPQLQAPHDNGLIFVQLYHANSAQHLSPIRFPIIVQTARFRIVQQIHTLSA